MTEDKKFNTLENKVLRKLAMVSVEEWESKRNGQKYTLERDGWHVDVYGPLGVANGVHAYELSMMMVNSDKSKTSEVSDGQGYVFNGEKVKAFYESLSQRHKEYTQREADVYKKAEQERETEKILRAFLKS